MNLYLRFTFWTIGGCLGLIIGTWACRHQPEPAVILAQTQCEHHKAVLLQARKEGVSCAEGKRRADRAEPQCITTAECPK